MTNEPVEWTKVAWAANQPEADLVVNLLREHRVAAFHRRAASADVPDFLGGGPRDILVARQDVDRAREILDPQADDETPGVS